MIRFPNKKRDRKLQTRSFAVAQLNPGWGRNWNSCWERKNKKKGSRKIWDLLLMFDAFRKYFNEGMIVCFSPLVEKSEKSKGINFDEFPHLWVCLALSSLFFSFSGTCCRSLINCLVWTVYLHHFQLHFTQPYSIIVRSPDRPSSSFFLPAFLGRSHHFA